MISVPMERRITMMSRWAAALRWPSTWMGGLVLLALAALAWGAGGAPLYGTDSWSYLDLAHTIGHHFYQPAALRSFAAPTAFSSAFPPLWPMALALTGRVFGWHLLNAVWINLLFLAVMAGVAERVAIKRFAAPGAGYLAALAVISFWPLWDEALGGRSIPLAMLLVTLQVALLARPEITRTSAGLIGVLAALIALTRFDGTLLCGLIVLMVFAKTRSWRLAAIAAVAGLVVMAPWMLYCIRHFGTPLRSDDGWIAVSVVQHGTADFFTVPPVDWRQAPLLWAHRMMGNVGALARTLLLVFRAARATLALILAVAAAAWARHQRPKPLPSALAIYAVALVAATWPLIIGSGFTDMRYFASLVWMLSWMLAIVLATQLRPFAARVPVVAGLALLFAALIVRDAMHLRAGEQVRAAQQGAQFGRFATLAECRRRLPPSNARIVIAADDFGGEAASFGAITGISTAPQPTNMLQLSPSDMQRFAREFAIGWVYFRDSSEVPFFRQAFRLEPVPNCSLDLRSLHPSDASRAGAAPAIQ